MSDQQQPPPTSAPTEQTPLPPPTTGEAPSANKGLIFSLLGLLCCAPVAIAGVIFSNKAKKEIRDSGGTLGGEGKATAGQVISWVALGLWAVVLIAAVVSGAATKKDVTTATTKAPATQETATSTGSSEAPKSSAPVKSPEKQEPGIGASVRDGKFEFVVSEFSCGQKKVGTEPLAKSAQGTFCIASVSVKNIGDKAQSFSASSQQLIDDKGRKLEPDTTAALYLDPDQAKLLENINPGNTATAKLVFDVAPDTTPATLVLHDSPFSGGVKVRVG